VRCGVGFKTRHGAWTDLERNAGAKKLYCSTVALLNVIDIPTFAAAIMKVYKHIDEFRAGKNPVVTTGTFDGVHLGHQQIIFRLKEAAKKCEGETVLLTFFPHPRMVLFPDYKPLLLNTLEEKISLLEKAGVDHLNCASVRP